MSGVRWTNRPQSIGRHYFEGSIRAESKIYDLTPTGNSNFSSTWNPSAQISDRISLYAIVFPDTATNRENVSAALYSGRVANIYKAIDVMGGADEDEPLYLQERAVENARHALALFVAHELPAPKIFPNGSEALIFKWDASDATRYAYLDEGILTFKLYAPDMAIPVTIDIQLSDREALQNAFGLLRENPRKMISSIR